MRRFPVAVVDFGDAEATRVYLDLATGDPLLTMGHRERVGRWLFSFLHSWDLPAMLRQEGVRLAVLLLLSAAGTALCATATVIGYRRLRMKLRRRRVDAFGYTRSQRVDTATSSKAVATPMNAAIRPKWFAAKPISAGPARMPAKPSVDTAVIASAPGMRVW